MNRKPDLDMNKRLLVKRLRTLARMEVSLALDSALNLAIPEVESRFSDEVAKGKRPNETRILNDALRLIKSEVAEYVSKR